MRKLNTKVMRQWDDKRHSESYDEVKYVQHSKLSATTVVLILVRLCLEQAYVAIHSPCLIMRSPIVEEAVSGSPFVQ